MMYAMAAMPHEAKLGAGKLTYDDLVSLPEDGKRYEILDGDLSVTASPTTRHQRVSRNLQQILNVHVTEHGLGEVFYAPVDVILDRHTVVVPDLVFVSTARAAIVELRGIMGAPDLLVEILSPSTADRDRGAKAKLYARYGVDHYWVVDPDARTLAAYACARDGYAEVARHSGDEIFRSPLFPDLRIDLGKVWG
jgi:Uma2 family endonuclease